jgi:hypothetical protein
VNEEKEKMGEAVQANETGKKSGTLDEICIARGACLSHLGSNTESSVPNAHKS